MRHLLHCYDLLDKIDIAGAMPSHIYIFGDYKLIRVEFDAPEFKPIVEAGAVIRAFGPVILKAGCQIKSGSEIISSSPDNTTIIGERAIIYRAYVENSEIGPDSYIGWCAQIKRSRFGRKVKMKHQAYVGDGEIGDDTNIGHQFSTANSDGALKDKTIVGKRVFLGDTVKLEAPITIGDEAFVGNGVPIRSDIPAHAVVLGVKFNEVTERFEEVISKTRRSFFRDGKWVLEKTVLPQGG